MRHPARRWLLAAVLLAGAVAAFALWPREPGREALENLQVLAGPGRDDAALGKLQRVAEGGSVLAQRMLGEVLVRTRGVARVPDGLAWLRRAARQGDAEASLLLGKLQFRGVPGLPADPAAAWPDFLAAVDQGRPQAAYYLGLMRKGGYGVAADPVEAAHWFGVAADAGSPAARFMLANAYRYGEGVAPDPDRALALYRSAAEDELPEAVQTLAMAYREGDLGLAADPMQARHYLMETAHSLKHPAGAP